VSEIDMSDVTLARLNDGSLFPGGLSGAEALTAAGVPTVLVESWFKNGKLPEGDFPARGGRGHRRVFTVGQALHLAMVSALHDFGVKPEKAVPIAREVCQMVNRMMPGPRGSLTYKARRRNSPEAAAGRRSWRSRRTENAGRLI
jgi:hypothetical protein